jgi:hypothetical protein
MQMLELVDRRFPALLSGRKTSTIRWNEGVIKPGFLLYVSCSGKERAIVWVNEVNRIPLRDIGKKIGYDAHHKDENHTLELMRLHYPAITLDTEIDLIEHLSVADTRKRYPREVAEILLKHRFPSAP